MNCEREYRWLIIGFCISYYFYEIREIYINHYNHQIRTLSINQAGGRANNVHNLPFGIIPQIFANLEPQIAPPQLGNDTIANIINSLLPNHQEFRSNIFARNSVDPVIPEPTWW